MREAKEQGSILSSRKRRVKAALDTRTKRGVDSHTGPEDFCFALNRQSLTDQSHKGIPISPDYIPCYVLIFSHKQISNEWSDPHVRHVCMQESQPADLGR